VDWRIAGIIQVLGLDHNLPALFSSDFGFDGITVAFLGQSPFGALPAPSCWARCAAAVT
jgi:ABC-type uncharacterized transport system permease subunit